MKTSRRELYQLFGELQAARKAWQDIVGHGLDGLSTEDEVDYMIATSPIWKRYEEADVVFDTSLREFCS